MSVDKFKAMEVFLAVVEEQGFSAASRRLNMPLPTVSRKVAELEDYLRTPLLVRSTRHVSVTDTGRQYYDEIRSILETVESVEQRASGEFQQVKGLLTITAPTLFGRLYLLPIITEFMKIHHQVDVRLSFTNHVLELPEDRIDLAFRIGTSPSGGLSSRHIGDIRQVVCGSKKYLTKNGKVLSPEELRLHDCIAFERNGSKADWQFLSPSGKSISVSVPSRLTVNTVEDAVDAVLLDCGLSQFYAYQIASHLSANEVDMVLSDYELPPAPLSLVFPRSEWMSQKVQAFTDFSVPRLQAHLEEIARQCGEKR